MPHPSAGPGWESKEVFFSIFFIDNGLRDAPIRGTEVVRGKVGAKRRRASFIKRFRA
jgi:hypothetical protein